MERALRLTTWVSACLLFGGLVFWSAGGWPAPYLLHGGLWLLISTPIVRVIGCGVESLKTRDWTLLALTVVVLASLLFPLVRFFLSARG
jgi:uncharacterized membrane protein